MPGIKRIFLSLIILLVLILSSVVLLRILSPNFSLVRAQIPAGQPGWEVPWGETNPIWVPDTGIISADCGWQQAPPGASPFAAFCICQCGGSSPGGGLLPTPCLPGFCTGGSWPGAPAGWECQNSGGVWTQTCCDLTPSGYNSPVYNPNFGYCSSTCNGSCNYWNGNDWASASCGGNPNVIVSCGAWSKCSPSCGAGTQSENCTDQCGGQHTYTQSCYTTYFQTFGGDITARKGLSDACLPSGKYILGN